MMDEDVEVMTSIRDDEVEDDSYWLRRSIRWQNRCFAFAAFVLIASSVVYVVGGFYTSKGENPIPEYDAQTGEVGNDATNAKIQEALDKNKHKSGNAANTWWEQHGGGKSPFGEEGGGSNTLPDGWPLDQNNISHHEKAWDAARERWNRTHPGVPFPFPNNHFNFSKNGSWIAGGHGHAGNSGLTPLTGNGNSQPNGGGSSSSTNSSTKSSNMSYSAWLAANVTLESGTMFKVIQKLPHDTSAFTEGLTWSPRSGAKGTLYESTGLNGKSSVRIIIPSTGKVQEIVNLTSQYFGEGMTYYKGTLVQITWKSKQGFVYNASNLIMPPKTFSFTTTTNEGWGLTYDSTANELIVSDGSNYLHFWNPTTFQEKRKVPVIRQSGSPAHSLNELEFWRGRVLANVWYEDTILVINPLTGVVEKEYDFKELRTKYKPGNDVLNGISVSSDPNILYITGKLWSNIFRVKLLP